MASSAIGFNSSGPRVRLTRLRPFRGNGRRFWRLQLSRRDLSARSHFRATFPPIARLTRTLSKKEHFHEARESLLGVWQTGNRRERIVLVVRAAEEVVLVSPGGDIESRSAGYDGVLCPTWAQPSTLTRQSSLIGGSAGQTFGGACAGHGDPEAEDQNRREKPLTQKNRQFLSLKRSLCYTSS
jgi:hypothetical protein